MFALYIIYCVIEDCKTELHKLLEEERLLGATLLVFANKQDLPGALGMDEIREVKILKLPILNGNVGVLLHRPCLKSSPLGCFTTIFKIDDPRGRGGVGCGNKKLDLEMYVFQPKNIIIWTSFFFCSSVGV